LQVTSTGQAKQPVPQILSLEQDHDDKDDHQPARRQWLKQWSGNALDYLQWFRIGLFYFNR
jgi:hypothetical protein